MTRCWVSIGSNVAREPSIRAGVRGLRREFGALWLSPVYESVAIGFEGEPFLNLVAGFDTDAGVAQINATLDALEDAAGRVRGPDKFAPRTLDLDLLTYGERVAGCALPREDILRYAFVLRPLADVAPEERHPLNGRTYRELWADMEAHGPALRRVPFDFGALPG